MQARDLGLSHVQISESPREHFCSGDETFSELERLCEDLGADDRDCVVLIESKDILSEPNCTLIRELEKSLAVIEGVEAVTSIADLIVRRGLLPMSVLPPHGGARTGGADPLGRPCGGGAQWSRGELGLPGLAGDRVDLARHGPGSEINSELHTDGERLFMTSRRDIGGQGESVAIEVERP